MTDKEVELSEFSADSTPVISELPPSTTTATGSTSIPLYDDYMCRICLEEGTRQDFIAPCQCAGSSRWVHRLCLDKWRSMREDRAFTRCTECLTPYELQCITNEEDAGRDDEDEEDGRGGSSIGNNNAWKCGMQQRSSTCWTCSRQCARRSRFFALVGRDLLLLFLVLTLIIGLATLIAMLTDLSFQHYFSHLFHMEHKLVLCYLLLGLFLFFAYIGLHYACVYMQCCGPCNAGSDSRVYAWECCNDTLFLPYYMTPDMPPTCCCIECGGNGGGGCVCECCGSGTTSAGGAGACDCCAGGTGCCECSAVELGHELVVVFFGVMVILAVIGVFISIFVGVVILQSIISRHIHVLRKWNLTKEYIVKDLAPGAIEIHNIRELEALNKRLNGESDDLESHQTKMDSTSHGHDGSDSEWSPSISNTISNLVSRRGNNTQRHGAYALVSQENVDETTRLHSPANSVVRSSSMSQDTHNHHIAGEGLTSRQRQELEHMGLL